MAVNDVSVGIAIGDSTDFVITQGGELHVLKQGRGDGISRINLGPATKKRFEDLQDHLKRISIHATDA